MGSLKSKAENAFIKNHPKYNKQFNQHLFNKLYKMNEESEKQTLTQIRRRIHHSQNAKSL
jgi:hydroxyethylthiazole kinase-like sugar kinase family protein